MTEPVSVQPVHDVPAPIPLIYLSLGRLDTLDTYKNHHKRKPFTAVLQTWPTYPTCPQLQETLGAQAFLCGQIVDRLDKMDE